MLFIKVERKKVFKNKKKIMNLFLEILFEF